MGHGETLAPRPPMVFDTQLERALRARAGGDLRRAVDEFRVLCAIAPDHPGALCELAYTLHFDGQSEEARSLCLSVLDRDPAFPAALACLGNIHRKRGEIPAALAYFQRAAAAAPDNAPILAEVAWCLTQLGRAGEAETVMYDILALDPRATLALRGLALAYRAQARHAAALFFFRLLAEADPAEPVAGCEIGVSLLELGRPQEAEDAFRAVLAHAPDHLEARMALGFARRAAGDREGALACFREAAIADPARAWPEAAVECRALGRLAEARDALGRAIAVDPENFHACIQLAELARAAGALNDCARLCDALIRTYPGRIEPVAEMCRVLIAQDRQAEALALARVADRDGDPPSRARLILALEVAAACLDPDFAREALAAAASSDDVEIWRRSAATCLALGDAVGARGLMDQPAQVTGGADIGRRRMVEAGLANLEWRTDDAIAGFEAALAADPNTVAAHLDLARLKLLRLDVEAAARHNATYLRQSAAERTLRRQSLRESQTQVGHLLNELRVDRDLLGRLRGAADLDGLISIVRDVPESTPAALRLLLALRESGSLNGAEDRSGAFEPPGIPRSIVCYWPDEAAPAAIGRGFEATRRLHPDWRQTIFDRRSGLEYMRANHSPEIAAAARIASASDSFENLLRLAVLSAEGGYFIDARARCLAPLDGAHPAGARLCVFQDEFAALSAPLLACEPSEAVIGRALELAVEAINRGDNDIPWLATGPGLLSRAFVEVLAGQGEDWRRWLADRAVPDRASLRHVLIPDYVAGH